MSKYLTKLKKGTNNAAGSWNSSQLKIKFNFTSMSCANSYKEGIQHRFETNDATDVKLLIDIIKRFKLDVKITNLTATSFEFESPNQNIQIFFFRICRYTRATSLKKILTDTILINKAGVKIQNAFLIAHYYNYIGINTNISYYNYSMDGFWDPGVTYLNDAKYINSINKPFRLLKDFKAFFYKSNFGAYNNVYEHVQSKKVEREIFFKLVKAGDFKAAEKYLLFIFK